VRDSTRRLLQAVVGAQTGGFLASPPSIDGAVGLGEAGITDAPRPRGPWDVVVSTDAPDLPGDTVTFVVLEDGTIVVDDDVPDGSVTPLADAVERELPPPYEAAAGRDGDVWCVAAHAVLVAEATAGAEEMVEVARVGDLVTVTIDGREVPVISAPPGIIGLLDAADGDVALIAERLDDATWIVERWAL